MYLQPLTDSFAKLIDVIGSLVRPEQLPSVQLDTRRALSVKSPSATSAHLVTEIFDLSRHIPEDSEGMDHLTEAFNSRLKATEQLVSAFIAICGKGTGGFQQEDLLLKYHAAQSEVRPASPTPMSGCLVPTHPGKEPSLATRYIALPTFGSNGTEGTVPQRPRVGPVSRRSTQQQDRSSHSFLPESQRRSRPTRI